MRCQSCGDTWLVLETRTLKNRPQVVRRTKRCRGCGSRTTTWELTEAEFQKLVVGERIIRETKRLLSKVVR